MYVQCTGTRCTNCISTVLVLVRCASIGSTLGTQCNNNNIVHKIHKVRKVRKSYGVSNCTVIQYDT